MQDQIPHYYLNQIDKILLYIDAHLDSDLSLNTLADIAHYSPYHFHRIFKAVINEPLNSYVIRKRIEKCAAILMHHKQIPVSEIAQQFGFDSHSSFTRAFNKHYGIHPSAFKTLSDSKKSKIYLVNSKIGQEKLAFKTYISNIDNLKEWMDMHAKIEIKNIAETQAAYITHMGVTGIEAAFEKIEKWALTQGLFENSNTKMARVFHDSFKITEPDKIRMSICVLINKPLKTDSQISVTTMPSGKCIVGTYEIHPQEFEKAWSGLFIWMTEHGYKKRDANPFEIYQNDFRTHPEKKMIVDLYIPIEY